MRSWAAGRRLAGRRDGGVTIPPMKRLLFVLLLVAVPLAAQSKRAFTIEDFYRVKSLGDLSLSADGRTLLFTVSTSDLPHAKRTTRLWIMDADGANARALAHGHAPHPRRRRRAEGPRRDPGQVRLSRLRARRTAAVRLLARLQRARRGLESRSGAGVVDERRPLAHRSEDAERRAAQHHRGEP